MLSSPLGLGAGCGREPSASDYRRNPVASDNSGFHHRRRMPAFFLALSISKCIFFEINSGLGTKKPGWEGQQGCRRAAPVPGAGSTRGLNPPASEGLGQSRLPWPGLRAFHLHLGLCWLSAHVTSTGRKSSRSAQLEFPAPAAPPHPRILCQMPK